MGIKVAPLTTAVMGAVSDDNSGIASGINNTIARAAGVLAIALMGAMVLFSFNESFEKGINNLDISGRMKNEIMIESSKFAAAEIQDGLSDENKTRVANHLKASVIDAFNKAIYVASL